MRNTEPASVDNRLPAVPIRHGLREQFLVKFVLIAGQSQPVQNAPDVLPRVTDDEDESGRIEMLVDVLYQECKTRFLDDPAREFVSVVFDELPER